MKPELKPAWIQGDGVITGAVTGDRLIVLSARFMAEAKRFLQDAYGPSVRTVFAKLAKEIGMSYGKMWKETGMNPAESFGLLAEMGTKDGWGSIKIDGNFKEGTKIQVDVTGCAFCTAGSGGADGKCDFMAGLLEGMAKTTYGREFECRLTERAGTPVPGSTLKLKESNAEKDGNWKTAIHFPWMLESQ